MNYLKDSEKVAEAEDLALRAHDGQFRNDGTTPYFVHPRATVDRLKKWGVTDVDGISAMWLHDTVEDNRAQFSDIKHFGPRVFELVEVLTFTGAGREEKQCWMDNFGDSEDKLLLYLKASDRLCNVDDYFAAGEASYAIKYLHKARRLFAKLRKFAESGDAIASKIIAEYDTIEGSI